MLGIGSTSGHPTAAPGMNIIELAGHRDGLQLRELRQIAAPNAGVPDGLYSVIAALEPSAHTDHDESDDQTNYQDNAGYNGGEYYVAASQESRWLLVHLAIFLGYHHFANTFGCQIGERRSGQKVWRFTTRLSSIPFPIDVVQSNQLQGFEQFAAAIPGISGDAHATESWPGLIRRITTVIARTGGIDNQSGQCIPGQVQLRQISTAQQIGHLQTLQLRVPRAI